MVDDIFNYLDDNYIYYILFIFINVFIYKEVLIKKLGKSNLSQRQIIIDQEKFISSLEKLIRDQEELIAEQDKLIDEFNFFKHNGSVPSPKPNPKKQAKPKKKRK